MAYQFSLSSCCSPTHTSKLLFILDARKQMHISFILLSRYHLQQNMFVKHYYGPIILFHLSSLLSALSPLFSSSPSPSLSLREAFVPSIHKSADCCIKHSFMSALIVYLFSSSIPLFIFLIPDAMRFYSFSAGGY